MESFLPQIFLCLHVIVFPRVSKLGFVAILSNVGPTVIP